MGTRNRRPRQSGAVRGHHARKRSRVRGNRRRFRVLGRHHAFGARHGHQLPSGAAVIYHYPTIDSTMRIAADLRIGDIVTADEQTAGQGRHGHAWHSERLSGLYCSFVLLPTPLLTLALGLAAQEAIAFATGIACDLRWPNDLMLGNRKIGGILVQLVDGKAIGGIGINVNHSILPPDLAAEATSLR